MSSIPPLANAGAGAGQDAGATPNTQAWDGAAANAKGAAGTTGASAAAQAQSLQQEASMLGMMAMAPMMLQLINGNQDDGG